MASVRRSEARRGCGAGGGSAGGGSALGAAAAAGFGLGAALALALPALARALALARLGLRPALVGGLARSSARCLAPVESARAPFVCTRSSHKTGSRNECARVGHFRERADRAPAGCDGCARRRGGLRAAAPACVGNPFADAAGRSALADRRRGRQGVRSRRGLSDLRRHPAGAHGRAPASAVRRSGGRRSSRPSAELDAADRRPAPGRCTTPRPSPRQRAQPPAGPDAAAGADRGDTEAFAASLRERATPPPPPQVGAAEAETSSDLAWTGSGPAVYPCARPQLPRAALGQRRSCT